MGTAAKPPTVIDLFAGVGGMSLGAARAGFEVRASVELDRIAIETHAVNFPSARHMQWDIGRTSGAALLEAAGLTRLDGLVGGPPCQGFSEMGKRAIDDARNLLFRDFFRLVSETKPRFFVAENVPGILAERNESTVREALGEVPSNYVLLEAHEVPANRLGAPTVRARVFFVGYDPNEMNLLSEGDVFGDDKDAALSVNVGTALAGLPTVRCDWQSEAQGWRTVERMPTSNPFYEKLVNAVPPNVGSPAALERLRKSSEISGNLGTRHTSDVVKRFRSLGEGEVDSVSRAPRLARDGYCPTLRAGTGSDRGSFQAVRPIHFRSPRVITPREAARLQGFPDWFQFHGTKWHSFRQIGNSVSPIVAEALLSRIRSKLD